MEEPWTMTTKELDRATVMARLVEGTLTQLAAAQALGVSVRQVRRLQRGYEAHGAKSLASKRRGRPSNRRLPGAVRELTIELVRDRYADFGPTLACEKLRELHGVFVSSETLRAWMTAAGLWTTRAERRRRPQPPRARRDCFGELVQIDGSDHEWFEQRGPRCTLLVYVDDATSKLMELRFARSESTFDYFAATERYLNRYGKPVAFYSDKASIFRVNAKEAIAGVGYTQFGRAMQSLNIDVICANTAAAKGRVERANQTLQDRLVKELRLRGICDREAGNAYLDEFREDYNRRFARTPRHERDAHRPLLPQDDLRRILTWQEQRRLSINLTLHYKRVLYVVFNSPAADKARGKRVDVREDEDGTVHIEYSGIELPARAFAKDAHVNPGAIVENKLLGHTLHIIQQAQHERDQERLRTKRMTLRDKDKLRKAMGIEQELNAKPKRPPRAPLYPPMQLSITAPTQPNPLDRVLAWANGDLTVPGVVVPTAPARAAKKTSASTPSCSNDRELLESSPNKAARAEPKNRRPSTRAKESIPG
jgi:transposase